MSIMTHRFVWDSGLPMTVHFTVGDAADANRFYNGAVPWVAGDVLVIIDGGTPANINTLPVRIGTTPLFELTLDETETLGSNVDVLLVDQTASPVWEDTLISIQTNRPDTYHNGIAAAGGANTITLSANAEPTDDYYNRLCITTVGGTGANQTRIIKDYDGTSRVATVTEAWDTVPDNTTQYRILRVGGSSIAFFDVEGAEPNDSSELPDNSRFIDILRFLKRSIFNRVDQNATTRTYYKDDSVTPLATMSVTPGSTQSKGKIA